MRKKKIIHLALITFMLCVYAQAQTLDEVLRPLLKTGQWDLSLDYKNFAFKYFSVSLDYGKANWYDSQYILHPRLAFGLARNLQLTVTGAYQIPFAYSMPESYPGDYWRETNTIRSLAARLQFRPAANMELSIFLQHGRAENDLHHAFRLGVDAHSVKRFAGDILILSGTWLSAADGESRPLRADLDGLNGPLLKKGRWRLEPEILIRRHEYKYRFRYDVLPDYGDTNIDSTDMRLRLAASFGLTDRAQVQADGYWQPRFRIRESGRSSIWWNGTEYYRESDTSRLFLNDWGGRCSLIWRPNPQKEVGIHFSRIQFKEDLTIVRYTHIIFQADLGTTWISKPRRSAIPLIADVSGIYHPLLDKKQSSLDFRIYYRSYRESSDPGSDWQDWANMDFWHLRMRATYGLSNSLQFSGYYGVRFSRNWYSDFKYEKDHTLGAELKWRLKKRAEIYAAFNYHPWSHLDAYPPFLLDISDSLDQHRDFLSNDFGEALNIKLGIKLIIN